MNSVEHTSSVVHTPVSSHRPIRWLADSPLRATVRTVAGLVFLIFGLEKAFWGIALGNALVRLPAGAHGFALYLAAVGVPFPLLNAYLVLAVEVVSGVGLVVGPFVRMTHHLTRSFAFTLMGDMAVATTAVGLRNVLHHPVLIHGLAVTAQFWRFPLEFGLLASMVYFTMRPASRSVAHVERSPRASDTVVPARRSARVTETVVKTRRTSRVPALRRAA